MIGMNLLIGRDADEVDLSISRKSAGLQIVR